MIYSLLAGLVAIVHFLFIVFVILGGLLIYHWSWLVWLHVPCAIYAVMIMVVGWRCPLTDFEIWLRQQAGEIVEWKEYIHHYFFSHLGWDGSEWFILVGLVAAIIGFNWRSYQSLIS